MGDPHIPYYRDFIPAALLKRLNTDAEAVEAVPGLRVASGLRAQFPDIESDACLAFTCALYEATRHHLDRVLTQRNLDRAFIDEQVQKAVAANAAAGLGWTAPDYHTPLGQRDVTGRVVVGPLDPPLQQRQSVHVPEFLQGEQVTLFGPPDSAKLSINAMNTMHRQRADEPAIVTALVEASGQVPRWGADNEDSKTPIMRNLLAASQNLLGCFDGSLQFEDPRNGKKYALEAERLSKPIKRIVGLALPDGNHLYQGNPLPLHLWDFAQHLFHHWSRPEALVFYVPKLENEEEAAYLKALIADAEARIKALHPSYVLGSVKLFIVFENPRAIFRIAEMAETLAPHFVGGSLGWHDFLATAARLFKHDPNYRIPVKADPNIVINHIRESHAILVDTMAPIGGIAIGGMYGVLYEDGNQASYDVSIVGFVKDVITQLKRGLDGFWVAHPDFVRIGLALVEAWRRQEAQGQGLGRDLVALVQALVADPEEERRLLDFVAGDDVEGLDPTDPLYTRAVLAASLGVSDVIPNHHPDEVRYNVFQALQYLADWLRGNGCVALPATMTNAAGDEVFVRVMDDLATTERSRWELWAELHHGRVSRALFEEILAEEVAFIRAGEETDTKRIQVRWAGDAARWYPIAIQILRELVTAPEPVEFTTQLLMPFTFDVVREADDPWQAARPGG